MNVVAIASAALAIAGCGRVGFDECVISIVPVPTDLVAHYPMEDDPSDGTTDVVGGHDGACTSCPTTTTGVIGNGYLFDGVDDHFRVPHATAFETTGITVAFWMRADALPDPFVSPVSKPVGVDEANTWQILAHVDRGLSAVTASDQVHSVKTRVDAIAVGSWHHVAYVFEGDEHRVFIDGLLRAAAGAVAQNDTNDIFIAADLDFGSLNTPFPGALDDLRIYGRALEAAEVMALSER